jgi:hypothetical protein
MDSVRLNESIMNTDGKKKENRRSHGER